MSLRMEDHQNAGLLRPANHVLNEGTQAMKHEETRDLPQPNRVCGVDPKIQEGINVGNM